MKKSRFLLNFSKITSFSVLLIINLSNICAQDSLPNGRAFNFPAKKFGISIGNSYEFNGIRLNFADRNVKKINGLNITLWTAHFKSFERWLNEANDHSTINGISIGVISSAGTMQPVNIGLLGVGAIEKGLNGITIGGLVIGGSRINGFSYSGITTQAGKINGFSFSGLILGGVQGINGITAAGLVISSDRSDINGLAVCPGIIFCGNNFNGVSCSGLFMRAESFNGLAISGAAFTSQMKGLSIALYNSTDELHGVQIGLLNYAGNNRKGFRYLPFFNMHLRRND